MFGHAILAILMASAMVLIFVGRRDNNAVN
jgi:hypothetical protein